MRIPISNPSKYPDAPLKGALSAHSLPCLFLHPEFDLSISLNLDYSGDLVLVGRATIFADMCVSEAERNGRPLGRTAISGERDWV